MSIDAEIMSQPECWRKAAADLGRVSDALPKTRDRVAVVGCGTSWFMAQAYAALREVSGEGETDAFIPSEVPNARLYDRYVVLSRSGTTTEILDFLAQVRGTAPTTAITASPSTPINEAADHLVVLDYCDETSVVQTRFATTTLALLRASLGEDVAAIAHDAEIALLRPIEPFLAASQFTFLGNGWTIGLASEAALKLREAAQIWSEAYPAMDYRHGPIAIAEPGRCTWFLGTPPVGLPADVARTGALCVAEPDLDPLAQLVIVQRLAVALAKKRGLNPERPRSLTRSVMLDKTRV